MGSSAPRIGSGSLTVSAGTRGCFPPSVAMTMTRRRDCGTPYHCAFNTPCQVLYPRRWRSSAHAAAGAFFTFSTHTTGGRSASMMSRVHGQPSTAFSRVREVAVDHFGQGCEDQSRSGR